MSDGDRPLAGKAAVVTGGAKGIGFAIAEDLARRGAAVLVADLAGGDAAAERLRAAGHRATGLKVDVASEADTARLAEVAARELGSIDILVNNAGIYTTLKPRPFEEIDDDEWSRVFDVNVRGAWLCARAVAPFMRRQRSGKIVNVSSMTVPTALPGFAHYVASKAAIVGLTRALARELGPDGICVNTLTPDYIAFDRDYDNRQAEMADALAAQRIFARLQEPEDMLGTLLFLLGPGSDFVTGQNIWVNGGRAFS